LKIVLYCPLNDPDDGGTSGDRRMARQLRAVLTSLGHVIQSVTIPRTHTLEPDGAALGELKAAAVLALERLQQGWALEGKAPDLWLTYHNYHKAPDLLGPLAIAALAIPYIIVEASYTASKREGPWAARTVVAHEATVSADAHFCFTQQDRQGLLGIVADTQRLIDLPPFIDTVSFDTVVPESPRSGDMPIRLVSVAMMRKGNKSRSYAALAEALALMRDFSWSLSIIGGGAARAEIEAMFHGFGADRVIFEGFVPHAELPKYLTRYDIFAWPGLHEPFGLVFLEAQAAGLPVIAFRSGGVPDTVRDGETAILVPEGDVRALAATITGLAVDHVRRQKMAVAARNFVLKERGLSGAAKVLAQGLDRVLRVKQALKAADT
jgi:glycosyltransferase involved in cell wall biosynthesis